MTQMHVCGMLLRDSPAHANIDHVAFTTYTTCNVLAGNYLIE